ncbi:probable zinc transporter protein DDB_G0291141 [Dioscorea cayenensis subsp. rotundata]|uniref:Probable zinc transporter protein DDB_G0291141 n=1 Tax=Dioscorea cayennensis subsp. rotundata TaxID=55577 RepID=A0AB40BWE7_DIOCR|nr:probable zinc transporter protein DDB_G0291141 [Dioscorea cayenensis subsp. rotundata]
MSNHRPLRHSVNPPPPIPIPIPSRFHPSNPSPFPPFSPLSISTPSKRRISVSTSSFSSLLLLLFSLRSLYSLLPFLRSSPSSFSLFPFSFLVSLLSLVLSLPFSLPLSISSLRPHLRSLAARSSLLTLVFLFRFQALRYCGTSATILADFSGSLVAQSLSYSHSHRRRDARKLIGYASLISALFFLSRSWDRTGCAPLSSSPPPPDGCSRVAPLLLPFLSGFLGFHERASSNWASLRQLGRKRSRLASLALTNVFLFVPALISFLREGGEEMAAVSFGSLGWPLINTVIFGVVIGDHYGDDKVVTSGKDLRRTFTVTFVCTLVLELFYFPKLSMPGFLFCGFLMWLSVQELVACLPNFVEIGSSDPSESLYSMIMNPLRHIMTERKSRKIALFLLINTAYMVVEFVAGFMSNSLGLISDACHMLFDCAALAIGLYASYISRLPANHHYSYGRGRFEVLSGYVNAVLLVLVGALIVLESFERILDPQEISTNSLLTVSIGGLLVNVVGLVFFHEEHHHAHGGSGACSHSHHSHHPHHSHDHHDHHHHNHHHSHDHHDHHYGIVMQDLDAKIEQHQHNVHSHDSSSGNLHTVHVNHCCNHNNHHNDDHHHLHTDVKNGNACKSSHEHQNQDHSSHGHFPDHTNNGCHVEKESCSHKETVHSSSEHQNNHSSSSKQQHHHIDHNMEGIFLHVLADTMGSLGVVISTLLIKYKGWFAADPACSIFISIMIVSSVVPLLKNSAETLLQRVPRANEQDLKVALHNLMKVDSVCGFRNLHVWNFTNTEPVATVHLHLSAEGDKTRVKKRSMNLFHEAGIRDVTVQVEYVNT